MTPLAMRIVKELTLPVKDRRFSDQCGLVKMMSDIHCFECSEIVQYARELASKIKSSDDLPKELLFLPAPKTWIENRYKDGNRYAHFLCERDDGFSIRFAGSNPFSSGLNYEIVRFSGVTERQTLTLICLLAVINSPKAIGRRQHMPHRGLERELIKQQKVIGKFPLHAWTEIILDAAPPNDAASEHEVEAHLTGRRARHFCRAHLRVRDGNVHFVTAHWRGDASIGIKRSRYIVKGKAA